MNPEDAIRRLTDVILNKKGGYVCVEADEFIISGAGADNFRYQHFGFSVDNDCDSFYSVDYVDD